MLPKAAVVCALLALFSAGSQGNKVDDVDHHLAAAARKERVLRFVGQPAVFPKDSSTCLHEFEYYRRLDLLQCAEKYIRAVFNEIETSNCTNEYYDTALFYGCGTNDNGEVCAGIENHIFYRFTDRCFECTNECRTTLRQLSDNVSCCIHDDYKLRMPSVWMNCNIEQPEVCADTPNIADALAKRNLDPCTEKCSRRQDYYVFCKYLGEEYEQLNRECGVDNVNRYCGFDKGEFCFEMDLPNIETINDECYSEGSNVLRDGVCSANCSNVLEEYIDTVGCCFNFLNNISARISSGLSSDLFSACGIKVPGACNSFNSTAVPDDFLECAGRTIDYTINTSHSGAALQSGVYNIGLIIIGSIATYIM